MNTGVSLYKEFCDHLQESEGKKKLLIKPDFATAEQEVEEKISDKSLREMECSMKKPFKPLIEIISDNSAACKDPEQISELEAGKQSNDSQNISDRQQKDVSITIKYPFVYIKFSLRVRV